MEERVEELERQVVAAKKELSDDKVKQGLLNEELLKTLKKLVGTEVFGLLESRDFDTYAKIRSQECTDRIITDIVSYVEEYIRVSEEKRLTLEEKVRSEKDRHNYYKVQLGVVREELRTSQEEIERLLTDLSEKIAEENRLKDLLEDKRRTVDELTVTIFGLKEKEAGEEGEVEELKERIRRLQGQLEDEKAEVGKLNEQIDEICKNKELSLKEVSGLLSKNNSVRLTNIEEESEEEYGGRAEEGDFEEGENHEELLNKTPLKQSTANNSRTERTEVKENLQEEVKKVLMRTEQTGNSTTMSRDYDQLAPVVNCLVPTFSGGKKPEVMFTLNKFLEACKEALSTAKDDEEKKKMCTLIKKKLELEAYEFVFLAKAQTFKEISDVLVKNFGMQRQFNDFLNEIQDCVQGPDEATSDYVKRFEKQYKIAINSADSKYDNDEARMAVRTEIQNVAEHTLKYGVKNPTLHHQLITMRKATVEELIEDVERFLREEGRYRSGKVNGNKKVYGINMVQADNEDNSLNGRIKACEDRLTKVENTTEELGKRVDKGFDEVGRGLNKLNQAIKELTDVSRMEKQSRNPFGRDRQDADLVECFSCKEKGHFARDCPSAEKMRGRCYHCGGTNHVFANCRYKNNTNWRNNNSNQQTNEQEDNNGRQNVEVGMVNIGIDNECVAKLHTKDTIKGFLNVMVDTGAQGSVMKMSELKGAMGRELKKIDRPVTLISISGQKEDTNEAVEIMFEVQELRMKCPFVLMSTLGAVKVDAIMGRDQLTKNMVIDMTSDEMKIHINEGGICEDMLKGLIMYSKLKMNKSCVITVQCSEVRKGFLSLMVDTGSKVSMLRYNQVGEKELEKGKYVLTGLLGEVHPNMGQTSMKINVKEQEYVITFQVVQKIGVTDADGIVGRDFLNKKCLIDMVNLNVIIGERMCAESIGAADVLTLNMEEDNVKLDIEELFKIKNEEDCRKEKVADSLNFPEGIEDRWVNEMRQTCVNNSKAFLLSGEKLTTTTAAVFHVPLKEGSGPIHIKQYRQDEMSNRMLEKQIKQLEFHDVIERSFSPYNFPVFLRPKPELDENGQPKQRMCVNFKALNDQCVPYFYPLPIIDEVHGKLNKKYFNLMDLSQGFHQVLVAKEDRYKLAFTVNGIHWQYKRAPFGLSTIPGFFQAMVNSILGEMVGTICFVYIDDILVMGDSADELNERTDRVLKRLIEFNLKVNPEKCKFFRKEITYLGFLCNNEGIQTDPGRVKRALNFPVPKNVKQVESWMGLANYYKKFIEDYGNIVEPILALTRKENKANKFEWTGDCQRAFERIKEALVTPPILTHPDMTQPFILYTDASGVALGAVLEQEKGVIAYASRTLQPAERRYAAVEREALSIVWAAKHWRHFLLPKFFTCYSDSKPLQGEVRKKTSSSRLMRFKLQLAEFNFEIKHRKGSENGNADALSRVLFEDDDKEEDGESFYYVLAKKVNKDDNKEEWYMGVVTRSQAKRLKRVVEESEGAGNADQNDDDEDEVIITEITDKIENVQDGKVIEIVDDEDKQVILKTYHDSPYGGHFGGNKTYEKIKTKYHWEGLKKDVEKYVKICLKCQLNKRSKLTKMPLQITNVAQKPWERLYFDIVEGVPESNQGNKVILSMIDDLTKYVLFEALPDQQAPSIAKAIFENIM